ncbi:hypothetical protein MMC20_004075 [Loxospora ochrophaea]|nr:hypothetical protein [Loxospora ochrophaea]
MSVLYNLPFIFESYDLHCLFFVERKLRPSLLTNRKLVTRMDLTIKGADWPGWPSDFLYVIENLKRFKRLKFLAIKIDPEDLFIDELEDPEAVGYEFHECLSELIRYVRVKTVRVYGSYGSDGTDVLNAIEQMMMGKTCALLNPMCEIDKSHFRGLFSGKAVTRTLRG